MRDKAINIALYCLITACVGLFSYLYGTMYPSVVDARLEGLYEAGCDEMTYIPNAYSGETDLVCEIKCQGGTVMCDNLRIWKKGDNG